MSLKKFLERSNNAIEGILLTAKTQRHLRYHLYIAAFVLIVAYILGIGRTDFLIISITVILVLLAEMMNTAVEYVVDMISPEYSEQARIAKDIGGGAVFITAFGAVVIGYIILFHYFKNVFETGLSISKHSKEEIALISTIIVFISIVMLKAYFGKGHPLRGGMPSGHAAIAFSFWVHLAFTSRLDCPTCDITYRSPFPNLFSFNSPVGACETCRGFGKTIQVDLNLIIPNPSLSLEQGAVKPFGGIKEGRFEFKDLKAFCRSRKIPMDVPYKDLAESQKKAIFEGSRGYYGIKGFFKWLEGRTYKMHVRVYLSRYRSTVTCPDCQGTRFKPETHLYRVGGIPIGKLYSMSAGRVAAFGTHVPVSRFPCLFVGSALGCSQARSASSR